VVWAIPFGLARSGRGQRSAAAPRRRRRARLARLGAGLLVAAGAWSAARASDHLDGPRATADRQADIADVFAFTSPENPPHVVLAMTVYPFATASSTFSSQVDYVFRVRRVSALSPLTLDATPLDVTCRFDQPGSATCTAPGGLRLTTAIGDTSGGGPALGPMRVFAGLRAEPAFFDRQGALSTIATGRWAFTGHDAFAGANVLAIVVELDATIAFGAGAGSGSGAPQDGSAPILAVAAETVRRAP